MQLGVTVTLGYLVRQIASLLCAGMLAWDYFRDPSIVGNFSFWAMALHFTYFQLPLDSRALPYMHSMSFVGACLVPVMYLYLTYWNPHLEAQHVEQWEVAWSTVLTRALLINIAPIAFHSVDITVNDIHLVSAYKPKSRKLIYPWALCSFPALGLLFELVFPESEETSELEGINRDKFMMRNKYVCSVALLISFGALYLLVLRRAFAVSHTNGSTPRAQRSNGGLGLFPRDSLHNLQQHSPSHKQEPNGHGHDHTD
jgi:hypothetical protein